MGLTILRLKPMTLPASPGAGRYLVFAWYKSRTIVRQASSRLMTHYASKSLIYKCDMLNYQEGELTEQQLSSTTARLTYALREAAEATTSGDLLNSG